MQKMSVWTQKNVLCIKLCEYSETGFSYPAVCCMRTSSDPLAPWSDNKSLAEDHKDGIDHLCEKQGAVAFINFLHTNGLCLSSERMQSLSSEHI